MLFEPYNVEMKKLFLNFGIILFIFSSCASSSLERAPSSAQTPDYPELFKTVRGTLIPTPKELKNIPEHIVIEELQTRPELLMKPRQDLIRELATSSNSPVDPTKHVRLIPPAGTSGYSDLKLFVNHHYYNNGLLIQPENLVEVWRRFILSARKEIILNIFDFDLEEVADALIEQARKGLHVQVGIDQKNVINVRPEVRALSEKLADNGVKVTEVNSVGLNHQKLTAVDWSIPEYSSVLISSGNLTRSCLEPEGDLKGARPLPTESIPNANHSITMKSWLLANLIHHELSKTLNPEYLLRGRAYHLNGSYQITGPGVDPDTLEAYPEPSLIISFSPGGGMKSINKNLIAHFIKQEKGRIRMLQFSYSSDEVDKALLWRAENDFQMYNKFDFISLADTSSALREWSHFLTMSGLKLIETPEYKKLFYPDPENTWLRALGAERLKEVQQNVHIAPKNYGHNWVMVGNKRVKVTAKIHHKIMATETFAILGTSFNFSQGAETNNEQILVFKDRTLSDAVDGMVKYLVQHSAGTVAEEAERRNKIIRQNYRGSVSENQRAKR
jgi:hypothetical protein